MLLKDGQVTEALQYLEKALQILQTIKAKVRMIMSDGARIC